MARCRSGRGFFIENLYDIATDDGKVDVFQKQKLERYFQTNGDKLFRRNKEVFSKGESKYYTCPRYAPCPLCDKCMNKSSALFVECAECKIPKCTHTYNNKLKMIKRKNFETIISKDELKILDSMANTVLGKTNE